MGISANDWNNARRIAGNTHSAIRHADGVPNESGIVVGKYEIDAADDNQAMILAYQPVWLYYPQIYCDMDFGIENIQQIMRVLSSDEISLFGTGDLIGESSEWVVMGVSRQALQPGEIGSFVISGRTVAMCYDQRLTDHTVHQHLKLNYYAFMADEYQYFPSDPLFVGIENGKFTPYISDSGSSVPIRARLIWRNVTIETTSDSDNYDPDSYDYAIVILPVFFQFRET